MYHRLIFFLGFEASFIFVLHICSSLSANDMALQRMRNLHSYRARQETLNQLNIATHPNKGVRIDEDSTMDWQQLPMKWPKDVMEEVDGNGADSHTSEKSTDALRQQYTKLRQKVTSDHEALISLRSEKKQLENLLEITSTIDETMANGGAETITHLEDACQAAQNSSKETEVSFSFYFVVPLLLEPKCIRCFCWEKFILAVKLSWSITYINNSSVLLVCNHCKYNLLIPCHSW